MLNRWFVLLIVLPSLCAANTYMFSTQTTVGSNCHWTDRKRRTCIWYLFTSAQGTYHLCHGTSEFVCRVLLLRHCIFRTVFIYFVNTTLKWCDCNLNRATLLSVCSLSFLITLLTVLKPQKPANVDSSYQGHMLILF